MYKYILCVYKKSSGKSINIRRMQVKEEVAAKTCIYTYTDLISDVYCYCMFGHYLLCFKPTWVGQS